MGREAKDGESIRSVQERRRQGRLYIFGLPLPWKIAKELFVYIAIEAKTGRT